MQTAKNGDTVLVHYQGTFESGEVFDSSEGREPLRFTIGAGQIIPGFEQAVVGMSPGQKKREEIAAADAYGEAREDLVFDMERTSLPPDAQVKPGDFLELALPDGSKTPVRVTEVTSESLTLDANHPLSGKTLVFDVELVEIES